MFVFVVSGTLINFLDVFSLNTGRVRLMCSVRYCAAIKRRREEEKTLEEEERWRKKETHGRRGEKEEIWRFYFLLYTCHMGLATCASLTGK